MKKKKAVHFELPNPQVQTRHVEIHLGKPYAMANAKCIFCLKPATRTITGIPGSVTVDGEKHSFTEDGTEVCVCNDHGIIIRDVTAGSDELYAEAFAQEEE